MTDPKIAIAVVSSLSATMIGIIYWVSRTRVDTKLCDRTHQTNETDHKNLRGYIKDTEERAEQRHKELRDDMKEVKILIRNGGDT